MSFNSLSQVINYVRNDRRKKELELCWDKNRSKTWLAPCWEKGGRGGNEKEVTVALLEGEEEEGVTGAVLGGE